MEVSHQYVKKRDQFGHFCALDDMPALVLETIPSTSEFDGEYIARNPVVTTVETDRPVAEHECNTDLVRTRAAGMRHSEGGWPDNVDNTEPEQVDRYLKKASKEPRLKVRGRAAEESTPSAPFFAPSRFAPFPTFTAPSAAPPPPGLRVGAGQGGGGERAPEQHAGHLRALL